MLVAYLAEKRGEKFRTLYDHTHPSISKTSFLLSLSLFFSSGLSPSFSLSLFLSLSSLLKVMSPVRSSA